MCGITGFINFGAYSAIESELTNAVSSLKHRGPNSSCKKIFKTKSHIGLGHRRLSILDITDAGTQPMFSHSGKHVICFNGEIYNHLELRKFLSDNHGFDNWKSNSDTETLVNLIEVLGLHDALQIIEVMFAIAIYNIEESKFYLCRDRLGEKPLYFSLQNNVFLFGSELKALRCFSRHNNTISIEALHAFTQLNYVPTPLSIYEGTFKCPQGSIISIDLKELDHKSNPIKFIDFAALKGIEVQKYWEAKPNMEIYNSPYEDVKEILEVALKKTIKKQMISDVPLGAFLSGGVDSSLIVALMQEISHKPVETFTIGFENKKYDESNYASLVAKHIETNHHELLLSESEALNIIPKLPEIYDEPFADSSQLPTFLVSELAKTKVTVSLSGDGGDELFGGYNRYIIGSRVWKYLRYIPYPMRRFMSNFPLPFLARLIDSIETRSNLSSIIHINQFSEKIMKISSRLNDVQSPSDLFVSFVTQYNKSNQLIRNYEFGPLEVEASKIWDNKSHKFEEKMMLVDQQTYLPDDILCKVDRASMASSLESRVPFLDKNIVEISHRIPLKYKIRKGSSKFILRDILYNYVPRKLIERPKQGFGIPLGDWINGHLKERIDDYFSIDSFNHGFFDHKLATEMLSQHRTGNRNWEHQLWAIYIFQDWYNKYHN